jgi:putative endopeptidase
MNRKIQKALISPVSIVITSCLLLVGNKTAYGQTPDTGYHAIALENLDRSIKPSDNFYQFAVGNWIKRNPVPASKSAWFSFNELFENNRKTLHEVLLEASRSKAPMGSNNQKIRDFFNSGMDSLRRDQLGFTPIRPYLEAIDKINNIKELTQLMSRFTRLGLGYSYGFGIDPDEKNSNIYLVNFRQGGLGLPDRDYYLKDDARSKMIREEYQKYISKMFILIGYNSAMAGVASTEVFNLEKALAKNSYPRVKLRDPYAN